MLAACGHSAKSHGLSSTPTTVMPAEPTTQFISGKACMREWRDSRAWRQLGPIHARLGEPPNPTHALIRSITRTVTMETRASRGACSRLKSTTRATRAKRMVKTSRDQTNHTKA